MCSLNSGSHVGRIDLCLLQNAIVRCPVLRCRRLRPGVFLHPQSLFRVLFQLAGLIGTKESGLLRAECPLWRTGNAKNQTLADLLLPERPSGHIAMLLHFAPVFFLAHDRRLIQEVKHAKCRPDCPARIARTK